MVGSASKQYLRTRSKPVTLCPFYALPRRKKMRFGRTLVSFIGLTVMLLCAELWLVRGLAAPEVSGCFYTLGI